MIWRILLVSVTCFLPFHQLTEDRAHSHFFDLLSQTDRGREYAAFALSSLYTRSNTYRYI